MTWQPQMRRLLAGGTVLFGASVAAATAPAVGSTAAVVPGCTAAGTQIWLGVGEGGGFAGGYGLPLEFSNIGHRACTLSGYPGVSAFRGTGQIGPAASRIRESHGTVVLAPGATAHAFLRVTDAGARCSHPTTAAGLRVYAPGQTKARTVTTPVTVCAHRGVLAVGAVRPGVGVPGEVTQ